MVGRWIEGRVTARQRADELTNREVITVEAVDGRTYHIGLNATSEQLGHVAPGDLVRVSGGKRGYPNVYLQTRLSLEEQVESRGRTWLDGKLAARLAGRSIEGLNPRNGMGADVSAQLEARKHVLRERGLIVSDSKGDRFVPDSLAKLYAVGLAEFERAHCHKYGERRRFIPGVNATGRLEVVHLPSGPHALLRERDGYRITPLRPQMMSLVGQEVTIALSREAIQRPMDRGATVRVRALDHGHGRLR